MYNISRDAKQNRNDVINDRDGKQVSRFLMEEIFQTCESDAKTAELKPHNCYRDSNSTVYFNFPESWFNYPTLNKAIGLRRIDILPNYYNFEFNMEIFRKLDTDPDTDEGWGKPLFLHTLNHITPDMGIEDALSTLSVNINREIQEQIRDTKLTEDNDRWVHMNFSYEYDTNKAYIIWNPDVLATPGQTKTYYFKIVLGIAGEGFGKLMNYGFPLGIKTIMQPIIINIDDQFDLFKWTFTNVWNRQRLFVHASFVNYTSYQYLGRNGEFYYKPSKIYDFNNSSHQFYIEVSFDGVNKTPLHFQNIIIELALMLDSKRYQAE
jgi:hypothetical protein